MIRKGLKGHEIERKIHEKIDSDPDLKYYIDNDYITKLIDLLIEGIAETVEENNKKLIDDINTLMGKG